MPTIHSPRINSWATNGVAMTMVNLSVFYLQSKPDRKASVELAKEVVLIALQFQQIPIVMQYAGTAVQVLQAWEVDVEGWLEEQGVGRYPIRCPPFIAHELIRGQRMEIGMRNTKILPYFHPFVFRKFKYQTHQKTIPCTLFTRFGFISFGRPNIEIHC
ncbi:MAG: hypothetical protein R3E32_02920 [Chitinophagales bacterium]